MPHNAPVHVMKNGTSQVIGQFRALRRHFSGLLYFRDPIALFFVFLRSPHGQ